MKKVIDGKRYNTETATEICDVSPPGFYKNDFRYEHTRLYLTEKGAWFIAGQGGPLSRWAEREGLNGATSGAGIRVITSAEARELLEEFGSVAQVEQYFTVEDA